MIDIEEDVQVLKSKKKEEDKQREDSKKKKQEAFDVFNDPLLPDDM